MSKIAIIRNVLSPNFDQEEIPVEFLVLHYTACTMERTLEIFCDKAKKVCAHFVIGTDGAIYDLGNFWHGPIRRGAHAGQSFWEHDGRRWEKFNEFSIGIELVNFNGNLLDYTSFQYQALKKVVKHLSSRFFAINDPLRIVGHEQIAGFRGKVDPGLRFDWKMFYEMNFAKQTFPERHAVLDQAMIAAFEAAHGKIEPEKIADSDWSILNSRLEKFAAAKKSISTHD